MFCKDHNISQNKRKWPSEVEGRGGGGSLLGTTQHFKCRSAIFKYQVYDAPF